MIAIAVMYGFRDHRKALQKTCGSALEIRTVLLVGLISLRGLNSGLTRLIARGIL
jgi:hypothetical protein